MKKIKSIFVVAVLVLLSSCNSASQNFDSLIISDAKMVTNFLGYDDKDENPFVSSSRYFTVNKTSEYEFSIDVNGTKMIIQTPQVSVEPEYTPLNIREVSAEYEKVCSSSRTLVCEYIERSEVLKDKEAIKDYINKLPIKEAKFTDDVTVGAYFSYTDEALYINCLSSSYICEWMIVHEFIHAISFFTHDCQINEDYAYAFNIFNEVMTDIIASSINPQISEDTMSGYAPYYSLVYPYISLVGSKAIDAYFYNYASIYKILNKDEFEFFVIVLENYGEENSEAYYNNLIFKWYANSN